MESDFKRDEGKGMEQKKRK